jgi:hypothetical protein
MTGHTNITGLTCSRANPAPPVNEFDPRLTIFHELMREKVLEILLVSSLYDARLMAKDGRLAGWSCWIDSGFEGG